jgi:hypothetical protein
VTRPWIDTSRAHPGNLPGEALLDQLVELLLVDQPGDIDAIGGGAPGTRSRPRPPRPKLAKISKSLHASSVAMCLDAIALLK